MSAEAELPRRCGIIGSPVAHSLSPALHRAAYRALGLNWDYVAAEVTAEQLLSFLVGLAPQWRGLSVTMPLKRPILGWCDEVDHLGMAVQAVNTVLIEPDGRRLGYNTDATGLLAALQQAGVRAAASLTIVGGGATAASALAAGAELGCRTATVLVRSPEGAAGASLIDLGERLGISVQVLGLASAGGQIAADLLVSTIPAAAQPPYVAGLVTRADTVFDVVYSPWVTPLLAAAERAQRRTVHGFELLLHQAGRQVELMTGVAAAPLAAMRTAGLAAAGQSL